MVQLVRANINPAAIPPQAIKRFVMSFFPHTTFEPSLGRRQFSDDGTKSRSISPSKAPVKTNVLGFGSRHGLWRLKVQRTPRESMDAVAEGRMAAAVTLLIALTRISRGVKPFRRRRAASSTAGPRLAEMRHKLLQNDFFRNVPVFRPRTLLRLHWQVRCAQTDALEQRQQRELREYGRGDQVSELNRADR